MTTRYNLRSRSTISAPKRLENEVFLPGSNNAYTAGRDCDMGADINGIVERFDNQEYDLSLQPDVDNESHIDSEDETYEYNGPRCFEQEYVDGDETEEDEDAYSVYSDDEESDTEYRGGDYTDDDDILMILDRQELRTNQWHTIKFPWQEYTTPRQYYEEIEGQDWEDDIDIPAAKRRRIGENEEKGPHVVEDDSGSEWLPEDEDYESSTDEEAAVHPQSAEDYNENLLDEYWRPTFSHNIDIEAALIQAPVNVNDPMGWSNNMAFVQTKQGTDAALLDNVIMIWRGESRYDETDGTQMKCYFFFQDISPFIYDYWDKDGSGIDYDWIPASVLQWFVPMDDDDYDFLAKASSWTPTDIFDREWQAEDYGEWDNEFLDTNYDEPPRPSKTLNSEDMELLDAYCGSAGYISEDSCADSIS